MTIIIAVDPTTASSFVTEIPATLKASLSFQVAHSEPIESSIALSLLDGAGRTVLSSNSIPPSPESFGSVTGTGSISSPLSEGSLSTIVIVSSFS